jgi:hypothetical protein
MAAGLRQIMLAMGVPGGDRLPTICRTVQLTADALMVEAFRDDPAGDEAMLTECKRMIRNYVNDAGLRPA